jgi:hypothetical protein
MSNTEFPLSSLSPSTDPTATTPREARGAAAVIAQYIQDLTSPATHGPRAAAA